MRVTLILTFLLLLTSCGIKGDPLPPPDSEISEETLTQTIEVQ